MTLASNGLYEIVTKRHSLVPKLVESRLHHPDPNDEEEIRIIRGLPGIDLRGDAHAMRSEIEFLRERDKLGESTGVLFEGEGQPGNVQIVRAKPARPEVSSLKPELGDFVDDETPQLVVRLQDGGNTYSLAIRGPIAPAKQNTTKSCASVLTTTSMLLSVSNPSST